MPADSGHATTALRELGGSLPGLSGRAAATAAGSLPDAWVRAALEEGLRHARELVTPVPPFLLSDDGSGAAAVPSSGAAFALEYLFDGDGRSHPLDLAVRALLTGAAASLAPRLALVTGTRTTTPAGRQADAVLVLACERGRPEGEVWAQAYRRGRWYRPFRADTAPWSLGAGPNLYHEAEQRPLAAGAEA